MEPPEEQPTYEGVLEVSIPPDQQGGVWANFARVNHSPHEFTIDFVRIDYSNAPSLTGIVVARIGLSPLFVRQLIDALQENWENYAKKAMPREVGDADDSRDGD
jgi:hypothetical protein